MDNNQSTIDTTYMYTKEDIDFMNYIRLLWDQHSFWTRDTIQSLVFDLPNKEETTERLLQNPVDFGYIFYYFYGDDAASEFSNLLSEHLTIAADIVNATLAGETNKAANAENRWYENADEIAEFLGQINPNWSAEEWQSMLYQHLALVKSEAVSLINGQYEESINVFDEIQLQALDMADVMADGLLMQASQRNERTNENQEEENQ